VTDDNGEVLIEDGPDSRRLRIALREFKGTPLLDVRYWYVEKKSRELRPTSKGISLTKANYLGLRSVAVDHHDLVMEYLDVGSIAVSHGGDSSLIAKQIAQDQQSVRSMNIEIAALKPSNKLYEVEYKGALATITLNKSHQFVRTLSDVDDERSVQLEAIGRLIVSIDFSLMNVRGEGVISPSIVADQFQYDFSKYAERLSRER
jgi:hypothetical protein